MSWSNKLFVGIGLLMLWGCQEGPAKEGSANSLLEVAELSNPRDDKTLIIDFRKQEDYKEGHIPGALNLWRNDIEDPAYNFGGMLAPQEAMEALLGGMGITNEHELILYDDKGLPEAARLWWALKHYGFPDVKLLNGGMQAWESAGRPLESGKMSRVSVPYRFPETTAKVKVISKEELYDLIGSTEEAYILVDARSKEEYMGVRHKSGAAKAGRIPGSVHLDWSEAINFEGDKKFKSLPDLERIFARLGANKDDKIIVYCHSGVRSSHTYFVLTELLGYKNVWNYDGSWKEWSQTELPFIDSTNLLVKN